MEQGVLLVPVLYIQYISQTARLSSTYTAQPAALLKFHIFSSIHNSISEVAEAYLLILVCLLLLWPMNDKLRRIIGRKSQYLRLQ